MPHRECLLAADCGTTSSKIVLIDLSGRILRSTSTHRRTYFSQPGYVEQSLDELWSSVREGCRTLVPILKKLKIIGISFSGTIGDAIAIDKNLKPLSRKFILYSDTRSVNHCIKLEQMGARQFYRETGNPLSPASCLPKWLWLKEHSSSVYKRTSKLIQPKDFLVLTATGKVCTDYGSASATMALNIERKEWSEKVLSHVGIDYDKMPDLVESDAIVGELIPDAAKQMGLPVGIPVVAGTGDTGSMVLGAGAVKNRTAILYLGGGAEVDLVTDKPMFDHAMRIPSRLHPNRGMFFTSITALSSGLATDWFSKLFARDRNDTSSLTEAATKSCAGANGVFFLPYLLGEQGAIWDPMANGAFIGLRPSTSYSDLCRSILESTAYSLSHILDVYQENGVKPKSFVMCGGGAKNSFVREIVTDTLGVPIVLHANPSEVSALGAGICAAVGIREFKTFQGAAKAMIRVTYTLHPNLANHEVYARMAGLAKSAYPALKGVMHQLHGRQHADL
ncbi:MAG TPA: FGGY family carbohydrate kinase [Methylomirabilota bacterium]|nr:FGGY family carbohydrate kinase [Methylomirabilota bacterium]